MVSKIWQFLTTDVQELDWKRGAEVTKTGAEAGKAVLDLAKAVQEKKGDLIKLQESIGPYIGEISSLLDVLNSPIAAVVKDAIPFAPIAVTMMQLICDVTKQDPTLEQCVALMSQAAYLESFRALVKGDAALVARMDGRSISDEVKAKIKKVGDLSLDRGEASRAITDFAQTDLAKGFGVALVARLVDGGMEQGEAETLAQRVAWNTPRFFNEAIVEAKDKVKKLAEMFSNGGRETLERYGSIDRYLREKIAPLPGEMVFDETDLSYAEIYVPLKAQLLKQDGQKDDSQAIVPIEFKILELLSVEQKEPQIVFLQGDAGQGKSVFCRMFADRVRRELFPSFTPILIRLRDLRTLAMNLTETLEAYLQNWGFVTGNSKWLSDRNQRFLFLLDGFDELLLQGGATKSGETGGLKEFLDQVVQFQKGSHHRFVITGRPLSLQGVDRTISQSKNLVRLALCPMQNEDLVQWSEQWAAKFGADECDAFGQFLAACPEDVSGKLAREPLLLYMLGRMHRDRAISAVDLQGTSGMRSKVRIYDEAIKWVLEKQRNDENSRLTGLNCDQLRQLLTEAALCVVQSGNETAQVKMVEMRLAKDSNNPIAELIAQSRKSSDVSEQKALNNLLTTFYIKPAADDQEGSIEFAHKSFGEFLFAERLKEAIEDWSKLGERRRGKYSIPDDELHWEIYDFLGYGGLTKEVMDYLMVMLEDSAEWNPVMLFERVNDFWERWCDGEFIDAAPENLPQKKMRLLREQMPDRSPALGLRQVDVFAGLNVLILLFSLHRYAEDRIELRDAIHFYPSGQVIEKTLTIRLSKVIHYSDCLGLGSFTSIVGHSLGRANLSGADFNSADLSSADLNSADLSGADLSGVDLSGVDLSGADLSGAGLAFTHLRGAHLMGAHLAFAYLAFAYLSGANLSGANLSGADLSSANLSSAHLAFANLSGANLSGANLSSADLEDIRWNENTNWEDVIGLESACNVPEALKQQLGL